MSVVAVASPLSLVDGFFFAGQNDVPLSSLCCGVCCCTLLSSSFLLLPLNFNSAFCCCSRGASSPRQEFASTFWMQSCFCFSGSVAFEQQDKTKNNENWLSFPHIPQNVCITSLHWPHQHFELVKWCYTRRFAPTILSVTRRCNVGTML